MRCHRVKKSLPDYIGDELSATERRRIDQHLEGCPGCKDTLDAFRDVWDGILPKPLPQRGEEFWQEFTRDVMEGIRERRSTPSEEKRPSVFLGWKILVPATTAAVIIIVAAIALRGDLWGPLKNDQGNHWITTGERQIAAETAEYLSFDPMTTKDKGSPVREITPYEASRVAEALNPPFKPTETVTVAEVLTVMFGEDDPLGTLEALTEEELEELSQLLSSQYPYS